MDSYGKGITAPLVPGYMGGWTMLVVVLFMVNQWPMADYGFEKR